MKRTHRRLCTATRTRWWSSSAWRLWRRYFYLFENKYYIYRKCFSCSNCYKYPRGGGIYCNFLQIKEGCPIDEKRRSRLWAVCETHMLWPHWIVIFLHRFKVILSWKQMRGYELRLKRWKSCCYSNWVLVSKEEYKLSMGTTFATLSYAWSTHAVATVFLYLNAKPRFNYIRITRWVMNRVWNSEIPIGLFLKIIKLIIFNLIN